MKNQTIWNLEDILDSFKNIKLDLELDLKNTEFTDDMIIKTADRLKSVKKKITEIKKCIKWVNQQ